MGGRRTPEQQRARRRQRMQDGTAVPGQFSGKSGKRNGPEAKAYRGRVAAAAVDANRPSAMKSWHMAFRNYVLAGLCNYMLKLGRIRQDIAEQALRSYKGAETALHVLQQSNKRHTLARARV